MEIKPNDLYNSLPSEIMKKYGFKSMEETQKAINKQIKFFMDIIRDT